MPTGAIYRILAVDDIPSNLLTLQAILPSEEFLLRGAGSSDQAFRLLDSEVFDLVLLDVILPGLDGYSIAKAIKNSTRTAAIPIIFLTELSTEDEVVKGFEAGGVDFVSKPFRRAELLLRLRTHLALKDKNVALEKAAAELLLANQERDRFLSILAHDLKNPFAGFVSLVQEILSHVSQLDTAELQEVLLTMDQTAKNVYRLLETLLDWGLSKTGTLVLDRQPLPLSYLLEEALEPLEESFRRKEIGVDCDVQFELIVADRYTVVSILRNLLSNAMKFTPSGGKVFVGTTRVDSMIELTVADTGIGIAPARKELLFRPEHKVTTFGTAKEPGTGLGLILCSEFAARNGGSLRVESDPGRGTTFFLRLPLAQDSTP